MNYRAVRRRLLIAFAWADPQIKITNQRVLMFFNFHGLGLASMPFSLWAKCLYWKYFPPPPPEYEK